MAKTIGQLTQATTISGADDLVIEQSGLTKRVAAGVVRGGLVNANIDAAAAIAFSKLAALDDANILIGNGSNVATKVAVTGDVTLSNAGVTTIGSGKVVTAMIADSNVTTAKVADAAVTLAKLGTNEQKQIAKAWVNFDGTTASPSTIRAEYNVSSITKHGTGDYTVNFTNAMIDANYVAVCTGTGESSTDNNLQIAYAVAIPTQSAIRVVHRGTTFSDTSSGNVVILR